MSNEQKTKSEALQEIGIPQRTVERFEQLAKHSEYVKEAKAEARENGRIVTRQNVLDKIAPPKTTTQSMKDFKRQAREEHQEFKQAKNDGVVDIQEAEEDNTPVTLFDIAEKLDISQRTVKSRSAELKVFTVKGDVVTLEEEADSETDIIADKAADEENAGQDPGTNDANDTKEG